jgi:hypothetical protein
MDEKFADRLQELGDLSQEVLDQRWVTVVNVANGADELTKVRLVLIACGSEVDRDADEWFWQPFREHEHTFKIEDGGELHTRLAHAAARYLVRDESDDWTAIAVRLAYNAGYKPQHQDLIDEAVECLRAQDASVPGAKKAHGFWTTAAKEALAANPGDVANLEALHSGAQTAVNALAQQINLLIRWAEAADARFTSDQRLIEWLLLGCRADGTAWSMLRPSEAAVDAARELAGHLAEVPQPRHEAMVLQVLAAAGHPDTVIKGSLKVPSGGAVPPVALAEVTPILGAVASNKAIPKRTPSELAVRTLWEERAVAIWNGQ